MRVLLVVLASLAFGCTTTCIKTDMAAACHLNFLRVGTSEVAYEATYQGAKNSFKISTEEKRASGNAVLLGGVVGGIAGGPVGAAAGGAVGAAAEVVADKVTP